MDKALNYKDYKTASEVKDALAQACPNGIDIYFGKPLVFNVHLFKRY